METKLSFGTYNVPSPSISLSASYTAPGILSQEMADKAKFSHDQVINSPEINNHGFDDVLKGILNVPKPEK